MTDAIPPEYVVDRSTHPSVLMRSWDTPAGVRKLMGARWDYAHYHIRPQSVLVCSIGTLWAPGTWHRFQDMLLATATAGYSVSVHELDSRFLLAEEAISQMRWQASMLARDGGVEWLLMVDNDALLQKDTLLRLLAHDRPIVYPLLKDLEQRFPEAMAPLSDPRLVAGQGLRPVRWAAMSVMLFDVRVFNVLEPLAWRGDDFLFGQALRHAGHRIYVDTDVTVEVSRGPTRDASRTFDEYWDGRRRMWDRLRHEDRNRQPPPGFNPIKDDGLVDQYGTYFGVLNNVARGKRNGG